MSGVEKNVVVSNISEKGIGFYISDELVDPSIYKIGGLIDIQFIDEYSFCKEQYTSIQTLVGKIVHAHQEDDKFYIGCEIDMKLCPPEENFDYPYYVEHRKSCNFVNVVRYMHF